MSKFTIKEAGSNDQLQIKEIIDLSFPRFFRFFASHSVSDPKEPVLISGVDGVVAGFVKLIMFNVEQAKCGCIFWIAVHPAYRRRGIAFSLPQAGVDYLKRQGARAVLLLRRAGTAVLWLLGQGWV
jgi:ribosomal protein S18 acetylase RimI-like enzyme